MLVAAVVSFLVTSAILKFSRHSDDADGDLERHAERSRAMKAEGGAVLASAVGDGTAAGDRHESARRDEVRTVVFACDAGMGSSAMGASTFRKRLQQAGRDDVTVVHAAIESIPDDTDVVVVHESLAERAAAARPHVEIVRIKNFLGDPALDLLERELTLEAVDHDV